MSTVAELREQARQHAQQLEAVRYLTAGDLAARWGVDDDTVRAIPRAQLPFLTLGRSNMRRYAPADVEAYEAANRRGDYEVARPSRPSRRKAADEGDAAGARQEPAA